MEHRITDLAALKAAYPVEPAGLSLTKEMPVVTPLYRELIEAAPFCVLATMTDRGVDCSPRGDAPGFVRVRDEHTLELPDRRGNNRLDSLRNIIADPRVGLIFLIPGWRECVRVRGTAYLSTEPELLESHAVKGKLPASVIVIEVERVYFQCSRAILRSKLWNADAQVDRADVPTPGQLGEEAGDFDHEQAERYDAQSPQRQLDSLY